MEWDKTFFDKLDSLHICVVGDIMLDRYLYGTIDRISPEAPVPVLELKTVENRVGGAANVAFNLHELGCTAAIFGVLGTDEQGGRLKRLFGESGILHNGIVGTSERPTTVKTRVIAGSQHVLRVDEEVKSPLSDEDRLAVAAALKEHVGISDVDAIILQDYNKGVLSQELIDDVLDMARSAGIPVAVDPKYTNFFAYKGVDIFKPNLKELQANVPFAVYPTLESLRLADEYLRERLGNAISCVTLGEHGLFLADNASSAIYPARKRDVVDVCGAGDAVLSVLTAGYVLGLPNPSLAALANAAGGGVCEHVGVTPVGREMLSQELAIARIV